MNDPADLRAYRGNRMDPLAVLERALAPEVVAAIDALIEQRAADAVAVLRDEQRAFGGRDWVTTAEAAHALGCTPEAVRMRHKRGRLDGRYQGRRLYISAQSIMDLGARPTGTGRGRR